MKDIGGREFDFVAFCPEADRDVFNATFNNISVISWRWVLLVEETGAPGKNHRPIASHWQTYLL